MSLFFIRFIERIVNVIPMEISDIRLGIRSNLIFPRVTDLDICTAWVRGKTMKDITRIVSGRAEIGKKVPLKRNMGVMKRKVG